MAGPVTIEEFLGVYGLVTEYAWLLDHRHYHDIAALCTDDVVLEIRGRTIEGHPGVAEWADYRSQKPGRRTLHQMTNIRLEKIADDTVEGVASLVLHMSITGGRGTHIDLIGEYHDEYVRTDAGWRFRRRKLIKLQDF